MGSGRDWFVFKPTLSGTRQSGLAGLPADVNTPRCWVSPVEIQGSGG